jgi:hypothetical protein
VPCLFAIFLASDELFIVQTSVLIEGTLLGAFDSKIYATNLSSNESQKVKLLTKPRF